MELKRYEPIMVKDALEGTVWKNLIHYLDGTVGRQSFTFTSNVKANSLLQLEKKIPECFLICKTFFLSLYQNYVLLIMLF